MTTWLISRHPGAIAWATATQQFDRQQSHLDVHQIHKGDCVYGTLPVPMIAAINQRGARYFHLQLALNADQRGRELSQEELEAMQACWVEYQVHTPEQSAAE